MRDLHSKMLAALLAGEGLQAVADLAAGEAGAPVALVLPEHGLAVASDPAMDLMALRTAAGAWIAEAPSSRELPDADAAVPIVAGDSTVGVAVSLGEARNGGAPVELDREEVLRTAALAALTEVAVIDARDEVAGRLRGSLLEGLRSRELDADELVRRAARLGCDIATGAIVLVAEIRNARPRHAAAVITGELPGALAEVLHTGPDEAPETRVYALLPAAAEGDPDRPAAAAARAAARLKPQGPVAFSSYCENPADLPRAVAEAELMLGVISRDERMAEQLTGGMGDGVYRLLFRALASDPGEVRRFYAETVEPLVSHDREYRTDLLGTLETYLANDCNMNATARAVYAHRHTVAHRLSRIRELSGLDPSVGEDRERLGLGIKAYRILEPTLPR